MSFAVGIENRTPFAAATQVILDADGQEVVVAAFSASFSGEVGVEGLTAADDQVPVTFGDVPFGEPGLSSTRYESDIVPGKPSAEIVVNGTAHAPRGEPVAEMTVGVLCGPVRKVLQVTGDRIFDAGAFSRPHPFTTMPIRWERAFGGTRSDGVCETRNPLGVGFAGARSADPAVLTEAPNVTLPGERYQTPSDRLTPAGLSAVGRGWQPRLPLAGTFDQAWLDTQWPLPPADADPRHHLTAPPDQWLPEIAAGMRVVVVGMTPDGRWEFDVPRIVAPVRLRFDDRWEDAALKPDTILVEPDLRRITLKARLALRLPRGAAVLREIVFGHVSPVWLLARLKGKGYRNPRGGDGTLVNEPVFLP